MFSKSFRPAPGHAAPYSPGEVKWPVMLLITHLCGAEVKND